MSNQIVNGLGTTLTSTLSVGGTSCTVATAVTLGGVTLTTADCPLGLVTGTGENATVSGITGVTPATLALSARGQEGTAATTHSIGEPVELGALTADNLVNGMPSLTIAGGSFTIDSGGNVISPAYQLIGSGTASIASDNGGGINLVDQGGYVLNWNAWNNDGLSLDGADLVMGGSGGNALFLSGATIYAGSGGALVDDGSGGWNFSSGNVAINSNLAVEDALSVANGSLTIDTNGWLNAPQLFTPQLNADILQNYQQNTISVNDSLNMGYNGLFVNSVYDAGSGTVTINSSLTVQDALSVANGSLTVDTSGDINSYGTLSVANGELTVDGSGDINSSGTLSVANGEFTVDSSGNATINNLSFNSGATAVMPTIDSTVTAGAVAGQWGFDGNTLQAYYFNGTVWVPF